MATITCANASFSVVQTTVNSAGRGDTVIVPAGSASWTGSILQLTKGIFLQGSGFAATLISSNNQVLNIAPDSTAINTDEVIRVEGFGFNGNNSSTSDRLIGVRGASASSTKPFRNLVIGNCKLSNCPTTAIYSQGQTRGVVYSNIFDRCNIIIRPGGNDDPLEWSSGNFPFAYGSLDNLYFEHNTIGWSSSYSGSAVGWTEVLQSGRAVYRYNSYDFTNVSDTTVELWDIHGFQNWPGNGQTGNMVVEVYGNTVINFPGNKSVIHRGSWGLFHNNLISGSGTATIVAQQYGHSGTGLGTGGCTTDVPGASGHYTTEINNTYTFNNLINGTEQVMVPSFVGDGCGIQANSNFYNYFSGYNGSAGIGRGTSIPPGNVTAGVGFWKNATPTPSVDPNVVQAGTLYKGIGNQLVPYYTPFTYPHPLTKGGTVVSVSPGSVTLHSNDTQQFTASATGVIWSVDTGSITTGGMYGAPSSVPSQTLATVRATKGTDSGTAAVTLLADTIVLGLDFKATDGVITAPFMVNSDGTVSQTVQTLDPTQGGEVSYTFNVTTAQDYYIVAQVNCPDDSSNSFFAQIDAEPTTDNIWSVAPLTSGAESRNVTWIINNVNVVKTFTLRAGNHILSVRGREPNAKLSHFTITPVAPPPPATPTTPAPANNATNVQIGTGLSWAEATSGCTFDVLFGTKNPPPQVASGVTTTSWNPPAQLLYSTIYYAIVRANKQWTNVGESGTVTSGNLAWSFTTEAFIPPPPPPLVMSNFTATPDHGFEPLTVQFNVTVSGGTPAVTYDWDFGDGSTHGTIFNPSHVYSTVGTFQAVLTVSDSGTPQQVIHGTLTINTSAVPPPPPLTVTLTGLPSQVPINQSVTFFATPAGGGGSYTYAWNFGDGNTSNIGPGRHHAYSSPGTYTCTVTVMDSVGSTASASVIIKVAAFPPAVTISSPANGSIYTDPATVSLGAIATANGSATITGVNFYQGVTLIHAGTLVAGVWTYSWTPVAAGDYSLTAVATDSTAQTSTSTPISIHVMATGTVQVPKIIYVTP